ncbi:hypothetical protein GHT06_016954 [Daphnia sinensis]|uniref:DUF5641 domain-containing protein n=1 Tax=Daphnia sinensis TaxID=1820382 RepID=A0AAD5PRU8_9CRUS|nr:hypothetical protein GHT06_016954 [Daphnia sinensis]
MFDNTKTFEKAAKIFHKIFRDPLALRQLSDQQVEWRFIPKRAPWYGGFWERLVGITKEPLAKILGCSKPTLNAFRALVADAEVVLNDRSLEEPSNHVGDVEPLCPAHLMYGRHLNTLPCNEELTEETLDSALVRHQTPLKQFEKRFINSYLPALREYHQATKKGQTTVIKEKDVVLVHDEKPRKEWKLAVVENLIRSKNGEIRAANIRMAKGKTNRPISKLHPIKVSEPIELNDPTSFTDPGPTMRRPTRMCAVQAKEAVRKIYVSPTVLPSRAGL